MPLFGFGKRNNSEARIKSLEEHVNYIQTIVNVLAAEEKKRRNKQINNRRKKLNARRINISNYK